MSRWRAALVVLGTILVLGMSSLTIAQTQRIVEDGRRVLLRLAPVDPRSLMRGDFMRLRHHPDSYPDRRTVEALPRRGTVILVLDEAGVGRYSRLDDGAALAPGEMRIAYRRTGRGGALRFGAGSFFFQEGDGDLYADADYGVLRVADDGATVLVGLADEDGALIVRD